MLSCNDSRINHFQTPCKWYVQFYFIKNKKENTVQTRHAIILIAWWKIAFKLGKKKKIWRIIDIALAYWWIHIRVYLHLLVKLFSIVKWCMKRIYVVIICLIIYSNSKMILERMSYNERVAHELKTKYIVSYWKKKILISHLILRSLFIN